MSTIETLVLALTSGDSLARLALADAMEEAGRDDEAGLLRSNTRVSVEDGSVVELPTYRLQMSDGNCVEVKTFDEEPTEEECRDEVDEWVRGGDWGIDGAAISVWWEVTSHLSTDEDDEGVEVSNGAFVVEVEPDHDALIRRAGGDTSCDHDWVYDATWSNSGTAMTHQSHCRECGLRRIEHTLGSQRNPGECDTVTYELPEGDE